MARRRLLEKTRGNYPAPMRALEVITEPGRRDWPPLAHRLLENESQVVRLAGSRSRPDGAGYRLTQLDVVRTLPGYDVGRG